MKGGVSNSRRACSQGRPAGAQGETPARRQRSCLGGRDRTGRTLRRCASCSPGGCELRSPAPALHGERRRSPSRLRAADPRGRPHRAGRACARGLPRRSFRVVLVVVVVSALPVVPVAVTASNDFNRACGRGPAFGVGDHHRDGVLTGAQPLTSAAQPCATMVAGPAGTPRKLFSGNTTVRCGEMSSNRGLRMSTGSPPSSAMLIATKNSSAATAHSRCAASSAPKNGGGSRVAAVAPDIDEQRGALLDGAGHGQIGAG